MKVQKVSMTPPQIPVIKYKRIGNLGRAIMEASKKERSAIWLKKQLDVFFKKLRGKTNARVK